jgi:hypothetical protein
MSKSLKLHQRVNCVKTAPRLFHLELSGTQHSSWATRLNIIFLVQVCRKLQLQVFAQHQKPLPDEHVDFTIRWL